MNRLTFLLLIILTSTGVYAQPKIDITSVTDWETMQIMSTVTLDLASAGIRLPSGRAQAESIVHEGYLRLVQAEIMDLQVDSSTTVADLVEGGLLTRQSIEAFALSAYSIPPALSSDMLKMSASYIIDLSNISSVLMRHSRPTQTTRILNPISTPRYTGIIIIASEALPAYGMRSSFLPTPCLFPKIWDSEMNLIYDRAMLDPGNKVMVRYSSPRGIFYNSPSGLSPELKEIAGERPLRIFARGVFGVNHTDLIIDRNDAMLIISGEENRRLLAQGKVVFVLNESALRREF